MMPTWRISSSKMGWVNLFSATVTTKGGQDHGHEHEAHFGLQVEMPSESSGHFHMATLALFIRFPQRKPLRKVEAPTNFLKAEVRPYPLRAPCLQLPKSGSWAPPGLHALKKGQDAR